MKTGTIDANSMTPSGSAHSDRKVGTAIGPYSRFAGMIATSSLIMYGVMFLNTYVLEHVHWSATRLYMTLMMTATMAIVMLSFMGSMLSNRRVKSIIYIGSAIVFVVALLGVRNQIFIQDKAWMEGMIPHHSIAILTSERANLQDLRVKALAARISEDQTREIKEMEWLLQDIKEHGEATTESELALRPVPSF